jgi:selenoprotein W-related protein
MADGEITITYCTRCKWMFRATWIAQELLSTFEHEIVGITLKPDHSGGVFTIHAGDELIFSRQAQSRFPDIKELKQMVRDKIAPGKDLGHSDREYRA